MTTVMSAQARARLHSELDDLRDKQRPELLHLIAAVDGRDAADQAERTQREMDVQALDARIGRLADRLRTGSAPAPARPAFDGSVHPGSVVDLDFGDGMPERFLVSEFAVNDDDVQAVTVDSPLGRALLGSAAGATLSYAGPARRLTVTVVAVDPPPLAA